MTISDPPIIISSFTNKVLTEKAFKNNYLSLTKKAHNIYNGKYNPQGKPYKQYNPKFSYETAIPYLVENYYSNHTEGFDNKSPSEKKELIREGSLQLKKDISWLAAMHDLDILDNKTLTNSSKLTKMLQNRALDSRHIVLLKSDEYKAKKYNLLKEVIQKETQKISIPEKCIGPQVLQPIVTAQEQTKSGQPKWIYYFPDNGNDYKKQKKAAKQIIETKITELKQEIALLRQQIAQTWVYNVNLHWQLNQKLKEQEELQSDHDNNIYRVLLETHIPKGVGDVQKDFLFKKVTLNKNSIHEISSWMNFKIKKGSGNPFNPKAVLTHGILSNVNGWDLFTDEKMDLGLYHKGHHKNVLFDLFNYIIIASPVGFGESSAPEGTDLSPTFIDEFYNQFAEDLNINKAVWVGNSAGGGFTFLIANHLNRASMVVPIDPAAYSDIKFPFPINLVRLNPKIMKGVIQISFKTPILKSTIGKLIIALGVSRVLYDDSLILSKNILEIYYRSMTTGNTAENQNKFLSQKDLLEKLDKFKKDILNLVNRKILLIHGKQDIFIPEEHAHRLFQDLPAVTLAIINKCGHVGHVEKPSVVATLLYLEIMGMLDKDSFSKEEVTIEIKKGQSYTSDKTLKENYQKLYDFIHKNKMVADIKGNDTFKKVLRLQNYHPDYANVEMIEEVLQEISKDKFQYLYERELNYNGQKIDINKIIKDTHKVLFHYKEMYLEAFEKNRKTT